MEKGILIEAKIASLLKEEEEVEAKAKYWRGIGKAIENKVSLGQSVLANITSMVKAGSFLDKVQ